MEWPSPLNRPFRLIAFDWDGTAVADRREDATEVREAIDQLLLLGVRIAVITGTNVQNIENQFAAGIRGPQKRLLWLLTNRGSEIYGFNGERKLLWFRTARSEEDRMLTEVAEGLKDWLHEKTGLRIDVVSERLNRRKIDLIPEWPDPPKSQLKELLGAVNRRLGEHGLPGGVAAAYRKAEELLHHRHLHGFCLTSDVKHLEIGLTDKSDSIDWVMRQAFREHILPQEVLIGGDEFGPIAGFSGSDARMITSLSREATFVSVGVEPNGVPPGVIALGGGPERFRELLHLQGALPRGSTRPLELPVSIPEDPTCSLVEEGFNLVREHEIQALFTVCNGFVGTLGSLAEGSPMTAPATLVAGFFEHPPDGAPRLAVLPDWTALRLILDEQPLSIEDGQLLEHRRILDLRQGLLWREWRQRDSTGRVTSLLFLRFASMADRHVLVQSVLFSPANYSGHLHLEALIEENGPALESQVEAEGTLAVCAANAELAAFVSVSQLLTERGEVIPPEKETGEGRIAEWWDWMVELGKTYRLDRMVAVYTSWESENPLEKARARVPELSRMGLERVIEEHRNAWEKRWQASRISVGEGGLDRALCFAVYHLNSAADPGNDCISIGARGLTGTSYQGHIFWDTEIYLVPFYAHTWPEVARALLMFRFRTLPAARKRAESFGFRGALYPWEATPSGEDATPSFILAPDGEVVPVYSGQMEHHISADIAYAVWRYWEATGDLDFMAEAGVEILCETARFWASRGEWEEDGKYHFRHVIGPDEYHVDVPDNAFTNGMAQANLEWANQAIRLLQEQRSERMRELRERLSLTEAELRGWAEMARGLYTGFCPETGLIEQFAGYFSLEDIPLAPYAARTVPIDILLGRDRVRRSQIAKQADVLMLIFLLWERFAPEVREANFRYYESRCGQGSSLSPPIHAAFAARLGNLELAERYLHQTAEIDLSNNMGNAADGVHIGALGGLWQAMAFGFAGISGGEVFHLDPHLLPGWARLELPFRWRGRTMHFCLEADAVQATLETGPPLSLRVRGGPVHSWSGRLRIEGR